MRVLLTVEGLTGAKARFNIMATRVQDVAPVAPLIVEIFRHAARETFDRMGERGDTPAWQPDTFAWMKKKIQRGLDPRTEFATHKLYKSLTTAGTTRVTRSSVAFGSNVGYAKYQTRQLIKLVAEERQAIAKIWLDYIVEPAP